jgi:hypothetical protein
VSETERLRSFEIENQIESCGLPDRQVGAFRSFKDFAGVDADLTMSFHDIGIVTHQAASRRKVTKSHS